MHAAQAVLKDVSLFEFIAQYQDGLPYELLEIYALAQSVKVSPCYTMTAFCPNAYLINIPPRFINTPYLQRCGKPTYLPNYDLFLKSYHSEPTLPLHLSIVENNIKHVGLWCKHKPEWLSPAPLKLAAICGHLEIVQMLMNASKKVWTTDAMDIAAMNGYLDIVEWISNLKNGPGCTVDAMDGAARYGHLEVVQFLNEHRTEGCSSGALKSAIGNGYAKVVEYLLEHRQEQSIGENIFSNLYFRIQHHLSEKDRDYLGVLQCLKRRSFPSIGESLTYTAIRADPLPNLKYIYQNNIYGLTKKVFDTIIQSGDKEAIRYALEAILIENNKPLSLLTGEITVKVWTPLDNEFTEQSYWADKSWTSCDAMVIAVQRGDLDTIKLLHQSCIKCCSNQAIEQAAAIGRLDIIEWLHTYRKGACTQNAMTFAATRGHLDVVKWLHEVGGINCPNNALSSAAYNGDIAMVTYLITLPVVTDRFSRIGGDSSHSPNIHVYGGNAVDRAASNGHVEVVKLLHDHPTTTEAMDRAVRNGHLEMVKYLHTHRKEGCSKYAYSNAARANRLDILKFLVENHCSSDAILYTDLCLQAADGDNIEMLKYCLDLSPSELSVESKETMMSIAVQSGAAQTFRWLHQTKGFEVTEKFRVQAEKLGHKKISDYIASIRHS